MCLTGGGVKGSRAHASVLSSRPVRRWLAVAAPVSARTREPVSAARGVPGVLEQAAYLARPGDPHRRAGHAGPGADDVRQRRRHSPRGRGGRATGYLLKDTPREDLFKAIRATARGDSVLSPSVASKLIGRARGPVERSLSAREIEVLTLVARGVSNKIIGKDLRISEATVKTHLLHIFAKLGVDDRTAAVTAAMERGVLRLTK
jgi:DNA-binding CsgD family transcriptional regulator